MRQLKARRVDTLIFHELNRFVDRRVDGLLLRRRIAIPSGGRILIVQSVDGAGNGSAGVIVRLAFDESGNIARGCGGGAERDGSGGDDGAFLFNAQEGVRRLDARCVRGAIAVGNLSAYGLFDARRRC